MKGHVGAVLTSGLAAVALALMVLFALIVSRPPAVAEPTAVETPGRAPPWTPAGRTAPDRNQRPREPHRAPARNRTGYPIEPGPRAPRRAAA